MLSLQVFYNDDKQMFFSFCFLLINPTILLSLLSTSKLSALNSVNHVYKLVMVSRFHST